MKKLLLILPLALSCGAAVAQHAVRKKLNFPCVNSRQVVKADFHMHTIFSDGNVLPAERIAEAYHEGLDAIAITDHLEISRNRSDLATAEDRNRSFELSKAAAERTGIINIKGTEITRAVQPGHANAIFITDAQPLFNPTNNVNPSEAKGFDVAARMAKAQGGFVFYNHPFHNLPDDNVTMPEQVADLIKTGDIEGIEVINGDRFSREGYRWAIDNNLTLIANSDAHTSMPLARSQHDVEHRAMTLVFAKERTAESVKEALKENLTLMWWRDRVIGREALLREFVMSCCPLVSSSFDGKSLTFRVENISPVKFTMEPISTENYFIAHPMVLVPGTETTVNVGVKKNVGDEFAISFRVTNAWTDYENPIIVQYKFKR